MIAAITTIRRDFIVLVTYFMLEQFVSRTRGFDASSHILVKLPCLGKVVHIHDWDHAELVT